MLWGDGSRVSSPMSGADRVVALRGSSQGASRQFVCAASTWEFLRDLGQTYGWHPRGTTYVTSTIPRTSPTAPIRHNYQPGGPQDCKRIEAEDAIEWAGSLRAAKHSGHFIGMIRAHAGLVDSSEAPLLSIVDEFIRFAHEGAFVFALDAESGSQPSAPFMAAALAFHSPLAQDA